MMALKKTALPALLACFALATPAAAQHVLPSNFGGWTSAGVDRALSGRLEPFAGDRAASLREYGVVEAERREYRRAAESLVVTLYRMQDATGAYGAATFLRTDEMKDADLGEHSAISRERAVALAGNLVLTIEQSGGNLLKETSDLKGLVGAVYPRAQGGLLPALGSYLPAKGQIPGSRKYAQGPVALGQILPLAQGDWVGFADGAEVELARYRVGGEEATLLLASFPTPQVAARHYREMVQRLALNASGTVGGTPAVFGKRSASLVALVSGAGSKAAADALLEPIKYDTVITWNEPGFSATDPTIGDIVVGTIYGTGAIILFAFAAGIGFGGFRVMMKYLLPGKLFDRRSSVEIIQLGINSKPIEAKDFYIWTR